jgi:hypothetical protein
MRGGFDGRPRTGSAAVATASGGDVLRGGGFKSEDYSIAQQRQAEL